MTSVYPPNRRRSRVSLPAHSQSVPGPHDIHQDLHLGNSWQGEGGSGEGRGGGEEGELVKGKSAGRRRVSRSAISPASPSSNWIPTRPPPAPPADTAASQIRAPQGDTCSRLSLFAFSAVGGSLGGPRRLPLALIARGFFARLACHVDVCLVA